MGVTAAEDDRKGLRELGAACERASVLVFVNVCRVVMA